MKTDDQGVIIVPWWLKSESLVVGLLAAIAFLVGLGQFWQHASDFEVQAKDSFQRIEQRLDTFALKSELQRLENRVVVLETRERDKSTTLTKLETQMNRLHRDIQGLEELKDMLAEFVTNRARTTGTMYDHN